MPGPGLMAQALPCSSTLCSHCRPFSILARKVNDLRTTKMNALPLPMHHTHNGDIYNTFTFLHNHLILMLLCIFKQAGIFYFKPPVFMWLIDIKKKKQIVQFRFMWKLKYQNLKYLTMISLPAM